MIFSYARVSTDDQNRDGRTSIEDQERRTRGIAMMLGDMDPMLIRDIGVSGSVALSERPAGGDMFRDLRSGDVLIASKMDRMFRSAADALQTVEDLNRRGVKVILSDMGTEPVTDGGPGKLFFTMLAAVAEFERWRIKERTTDGQRGKKARGGHIGGEAPYGWRKVGAGRDAMLERNEDEQDVIARVMMLYSADPSYNRVALKITADGVRAREGKFNKTQIRRIVLRNLVQSQAADVRQQQLHQH
jgi:putative DNA-invertase from lambdoid prophage Rac